VRRPGRGPPSAPAKIYILQQLIIDSMQGLSGARESITVNCVCLDFLYFFYLSLSMLNNPVSSYLQYP
jgi:hypothetical protein